jgi:hypothetical protein
LSMKSRLTGTNTRSATLRHLHHIYKSLMGVRRVDWTVGEDGDNEQATTLTLTAQTINAKTVKAACKVITMPLRAAFASQRLALAA